LTTGGALGLTIVASIAGARTNYLIASGVALPLALNSGYHVAFFIGAVFAAVAALVAAVFLRTGQERQVSAHDREKDDAALRAGTCDD
jgi:hypothetical protein